MINIAVFASGNGSNFQAIYEAVKHQRLDANISLVVCDRPGAQVIARAEKVGIPVFSFSAKDYESKSAYEEDLLIKLREHRVQLVVLAGYMRIVGEMLLEAFPGGIVNIHPSLLPSFPGKDAVEQAVAAGVKVTGVTVHYVDEGVDTGPIIAQQSVSIREGESIEAVTKRIHEVEHAIYPKILQKVIHRHLSILN